MALIFLCKYSIHVFSAKHVFSTHLPKFCTVQYIIYIFMHRVKYVGKNLCYHAILGYNNVHNAAKSIACVPHLLFILMHTNFKGQQLIHCFHNQPGLLVIHEIPIIVHVKYTSYDIHETLANGFGSSTKFISLKYLYMQYIHGISLAC